MSYSEYRKARNSRTSISLNAFRGSALPSAKNCPVAWREVQSDRKKRSPVWLCDIGFSFATGSHAGPLIRQDDGVALFLGHVRMSCTATIDYRLEF